MPARNKIVIGVIVLLILVTSLVFWPRVNTKDNVYENTNSLLYENSALGFSLELPTAFNGFRTKGTRADYPDYGRAYLQFWLPVVDAADTEKWGDSAQVFSIRVTPVSSWAELQADCNKDPNPDCPYAVLGHNDKYYFDFVSIPEGPTSFSLLMRPDYLEKHFWVEQDHVQSTEY